MKIFVFGNVGAGKTSIVATLKKSLMFEVLAIDDFRRQYGDYTKEGELLARRKFFNSVVPDKNQIIESIGVGKVGDDLFELIKDGTEQIICLIVKVPKEVCFERLSHRVWDIPFHLPLENVKSLVERTHIGIENEYIQHKWGELKNILFIIKENQTKDDFEDLVSQVLHKVKQA